MFNHETFQQTETTFNNIYLGVVENNVDGDEAGKVQVRIAGLHTPEKTKTNIGGVPTSELPWALPMMPIMGGGVSGLGYNGVPRQGDWVVIFFIGGDHNHPIYMGVIKGSPVTAPDSSKGFNDPDGVYPETLGEPDWNNKSAEIKAEKDTNLETFEPSSVADPTYPNNTVLETPDDGVFVEYDHTPSKERWHVYHKASKSYIEIYPNGDMVLKSTNNKFEITTNDRKIFIKNNDTQRVDGNRDIDINGNETKDVAGTMGETVTGAVTEDYKANQTTDVGGALTINVTGVCTLNGATINLVAGGVNLGDASGGKELVTDALIALFNGHIHSGIYFPGAYNSGPPVVPMTTVQTTTKTKAT